MNILCMLGLHAWTSNNKLSKAIMVIEFGQPFGCVRCGIRKDAHGHKYPSPKHSKEQN